MKITAYSYNINRNLSINRLTTAQYLFNNYQNIQETIKNKWGFSTVLVVWKSIINLKINNNTVKEVELWKISKIWKNYNIKTKNKDLLLEFFRNNQINYSLNNVRIIISKEDKIYAKINKKLGKKITLNLEKNQIKLKKYKTKNISMQIYLKRFGYTEISTDILSSIVSKYL